ncbi:MAG TPA: hypothetical protein VGK54_16225 [Chloroflexota bacterium]|jgi:hypothetical protein
MEPVVLCSDAQRDTLGEWSFRGDFAKGRQHFVAIARSIYLVLAAELHGDGRQGFGSAH